MIIVKLTGGLGNQLFQYAHGKAEALKMGTSLSLDISWYKGRIDRSYMLNNFNIESNIANRLQIFLKLLFKKSDYIVGDWQSEKYFKDYEDAIRKEFELKSLVNIKNSDAYKNIKLLNSISIHLRGGDYVRGNKSAFHGTCSPEYYSQAIGYIETNTTSPHFFIFTDDIDWAKQHIKFPEPYTLVSSDRNRPYDELFLMSQCKHNIIANSTFSWWAAWLNNNKNKIVIAPKKWFNDEKIDTSDILPSSWRKI